jgi:hypothetical protein
MWIKGDVCKIRQATPWRPLTSLSTKFRMVKTLQRTILKAEIEFVFWGTKNTNNLSMLLCNEVGSINGGLKQQPLKWPCIFFETKNSVDGLYESGYSEVTAGSNSLKNCLQERKLIRNQTVLFTWHFLCVNTSYVLPPVCNPSYVLPPVCESIIRVTACVWAHHTCHSLCVSPSYVLPQPRYPLHFLLLSPWQS